MNALALPNSLREELRALTEAGFYGNEESVVADAVRLLFAARPDLRHVAACRLYAKEIFSLGRAAEWAGLSIEDFKALLAEHGIERMTLDDRESIEAMVRGTVL